MRILDKVLSLLCGYVITVLMGLATLLAYLVGDKVVCIIMFILGCIVLYVLKIIEEQ